ncbi:hypothetical protein J4050_09405 [Winogradskyella sp. DF17]|uniref:Gingipain domain-containing protein n=1 Tax=Winogradskyella pelagia TaxID=2819984 RepID=A0ABS3T3W2_9FLAO|nr:hypothetical protein [Winogradskyella sp. DF17]MBO3116964.1 hypothetical protein [Winogradskyella sp. DF17]
MADTLLITDENDVRAGFFFNICKEVIEEYFTSSHIQFSSLTSPQIHHTGIAAFANPKERFIIGAFSHGSSVALTRGNQDYISTNLNGVALTGGFIYTFACSSGLTLGADLINDNGVLCYIGYKKKIWIWNNEHLGAFVSSATIGFIEFFNGQTSFEIIELIKEKINEEIDRIYKLNYAVAADLKRNRDALILHGIDVSIQDF